MRLRELERQWETTRDLDDEWALVQERLRLGMLCPSDISIARLIQYPCIPECTPVIEVDFALQFLLKMAMLRTIQMRHHLDELDDGKLHKRTAMCWNNPHPNDYAHWAQHGHTGAECQALNRAWKKLLENTPIARYGFSVELCDAYNQVREVTDHKGYPRDAFQRASIRLIGPWLVGHPEPKLTPGR